MAATNELQRMEDRITKRFDDVGKRFDDVGKRFDDVNKRLDVAREGAKSREQCIRLGFETLQKALQPQTLMLLCVLVAIGVGGSSAAVVVLQSYLPHPAAPNVQINSNNDAAHADGGQ